MTNCSVKVSEHTERLRVPCLKLTLCSVLSLCCRVAADRRDQPPWKRSGSLHAAAGQPAGAPREEGRRDPGLHTQRHQAREKQHHPARPHRLRLVQRSTGRLSRWPAAAFAQATDSSLCCDSSSLLRRENAAGADSGPVSGRPVRYLWLHHANSSWLRGRGHRVGHRQAPAGRQLLGGESAARWAASQPVAAARCRRPYSVSETILPIREAVNAAI